jgi:hypothetical protein
MGASLSSFGYALFKQNNFAMGCGKAFGSRLAFGMGLNYVETSIVEYGTKKIVSAEAAVQSKPFSNLTIGAAIKNITQSRIANDANERMPTLMQLGAHYLFSEKFMLIAEVEKIIDKKPSLKVGAEYRPVQVLYLRGGINTYPAMHSFGMGVIAKQLKIDIAANYHWVLGLSTQLGVMYEFKQRDKSQEVKTSKP